jgi:outer membrane protein OmpA-like peptidoglycan-associated protein
MTTPLMRRLRQAAMIGTAIWLAGFSIPGMAEQQPPAPDQNAQLPTPAPDLTKLQSSLAAERQRIEALAKLAERNQQLRADLARLHEQVQVSEGRAANAEAERDQLRAQLGRTEQARAQLESDLGKLREQAASAVEDARRSLVTVVSRIKDMNAVAATDVQTEPAAPAQFEQPAAPVVSAPSQPVKHPTRVAVQKTAPVPAAKAPEPEQTASIEDPHTDQRGVLGGRPAALSFANLPTEKRIQIRKLLADLHSGMDERGLVTTVPADALFATGSDRLRPDASGTLGKVGQLIKAAGNRQVLIVGHTDGLGASSYDQHLSERRAETVKQYLVDNFALAPTRLTAEGRGDSRPVASNATPEANRRIEVMILN